jgi:YfiH family protein
VSVVEPLVFDLPGGGHVLFSAREDGNMSSVGGADAEHGGHARARLRERIGVRRLARGYQVHGAVVRCVVEEQEEKKERATSDVEEADGQATALRDVGAMVLTADCLPIALGSSGAVAMLHAGWRGLAAGVLEEGVSALRRLDGSQEEEEGEMLAVIGPGAGACCYEVGPEVRLALTGACEPARRRIDLKAIARERLLAAGVAGVLDARACTICDERFFSHRREGARAGRQAGVAWLS